MEAKADGYINKTQFCFRGGFGTRNAIGVMRILSEKVLDHGKELFVDRESF